MLRDRGRTRSCTASSTTGWSSSARRRSSKDAKRFPASTTPRCWRICASRCGGSSMKSSGARRRITASSQADYLLLNERLANFYGGETRATASSACASSPSSARAWSRIRTCSPRSRTAAHLADSSRRLPQPQHRRHALKDPVGRGGVRGREVRPDADDAREGDRADEERVVHGLSLRRSIRSGFTLEHFDAVGRWRTQDNNKPVDRDRRVLRPTKARPCGSPARGRGDIRREERERHRAFVRQLFHHTVKQARAGVRRPDAGRRCRARFAAARLQHPKAARRDRRGLCDDTASRNRRRVAAERSASLPNNAHVSMTMHHLLNRRQFLRDLGISAAALPFLAGLPSLTGAPLPQRRQRLVIMFSPNGTLPNEFWPDEEGEASRSSRSSQPLEPFKDRTLVLNGIDNKVRGDGDSHMRGMSCLLTGERAAARATSRAAATLPPAGRAASRSTRRSRTFSKAGPRRARASARWSLASPCRIAPIPGRA